ncbi:MAG TPA: GNVR domain-containing protein, partial [Candidatus Manganitrophaceae bacterium]
YDNTKKNYEVLLDKKLSAKISENLEKRQKGEQFRILDAANLPEKPFKPDRFKVGLAGLLLGLGGGLALAFVREQFDSSIRKPEEVERVTSVPVLVSIPDFTEEAREFEKRAKKMMVGTKKSEEEAHGA